jgi:signal transduction histidine kinase
MLSRTMVDEPGRTAFFDDRHTDARMRALIARFARLGSYLTLATAPLLAHGVRLGWLLANAAAAFVVTLTIEHWNLLDRATDRQLQALLLMYGALIGNGTGLAGAKAAPYVLMQALPVLFAAVFYKGPSRYWVAVGLAAEHAAFLAMYGSVHAGYDLTVLALCLIVAHFGAQVSAVLREALATNRALHSVLEVTNDAPGSEHLPEIGLAAAMSVVGWDAGAVVLRDGDLLRVAAVYGAGDAARAAYEANPMRVGGAGMAPEIVRTGEARYVPDVRALLGDDSPVVRDGVVCMIGVPIQYHGENIGALVIDSRRPRTPDEREWERLGQVAVQLGLALGNMRAYVREAQLSDDLRELNRRKDAFLATVSHELRTPATTITLAARTLRDAEARLDAADREYAHDLLVRRSEELSRLIESLLDEALAESDAVHLELGTLDWCAQLERWAGTARAQTGRTITVEVPDHPVTTMGDPAKTERVVSNLLSNAAKFSAAGTPIRLALTSDEESVYVTVSDEGIGIPDDERDRIFERFYQVEAHATRQRGGFGIGLSLVRRFVEAHGGDVTVKSVPGAGSTFTVRMPRTTVPAGRRTQPEPTAAAR